MKKEVKSVTSARSVAIKLTEDVKSGYEADETNAHDEDDGGGDLEAGSVVGVESEHVAAAGGGGDGGGVGGSAEATAAHAGGRGGGATGSDADRAGSGGTRGGGGLRLRGASCHCCGDFEEEED